jgi:hypothetical protein
MSKINFYNALKNSYADRKQQKTAFVKEGFVFDSDLSNHEHQVYYNPNEKKMLYSVKGTNPLSLKDLGTDLYLASGHLKDTSRFREEKANLEKAKKRYNPTNTTIAGHSLGASLSQYIAGKNDKVFTLDKGATFGQKTRSNETAFRVQGDAVSALNANSKRMTTLRNPNWKTGIVSLDAYIAHDVDNIKGSKIFI